MGTQGFKRVAILGIVFLVLVVVPDPLPFIDEVIVGGATALEAVKLFI